MALFTDIALLSSASRQRLHSGVVRSTLISQQKDAGSNPDLVLCLDLHVLAVHVGFLRALQLPPTQINLSKVDSSKI